MGRVAPQVNDAHKPVVLLSCIETAGLLRISTRTLENMRLENRGPPYLRLGRERGAKVVYRLHDVEQWLTRFAGS